MPGLTGHLHPWRIQFEVSALIGLFQGLQGEDGAVDADAGSGYLTQQLCTFQLAGGLQQQGAIAQGEEFAFRKLHFHAQTVAQGHFHQAFGHAAVTERPGRYHLPGYRLRAEPAPVGLQLVRIRHIVRKRSMFEQVNLVSGLLEFRGNDLPCIHGGDAEGHQGGRHVNVLEGSAHGILSANGRQAQLLLHPEGSQQGAQRLAPGMGIGGHPLKIFLVGEAHMRPVGSGGGHFGAGLHHRIGGAVVRAPEGQVRVVSEGHHAGGVGKSVGGKLLDGDLRFRGLAFSAVRHEHGGTADGGVEHLHQPLLGGHIGGCHHGKHLFFQRGAFRFPYKRIALLHRSDGGLGEMRGAGAVNEFPREVADFLPVEEHPHPSGCGNIGHMSDFYIVQGAEFLEALHGGSLHHHGHTLLGLADGQFRGVEAGIFHRYAVQIDVQARRQFADGHAYAAGAKVVGFLDKARYLRTAEQPLELTLLGGITLLDFAAAGFQGGLRVLLGRARGPADAVPARPAAQQQDHIARRRSFPAHGRCLNGTHHSTDFHALGGIAVGIDFPHVGSCQTYLVAIAGIAAGRLSGNHPLGQLTGDSIGHPGGDVAGAGNAHGLVYIGPAGKRVPNGAAQAGGRAAEGFYFRGMVMCLVLELEQPLLHFSVYIHVHEDAAGVVFLALLQVFQLALEAEPAGAQGGQFHQAEGFPLPAQVLPHLSGELQGTFQLGLHKAFFHRNFLNLRGKGGVAAMVAPVGIQDAEFRFRRIPALFPEVLHHLAEVVDIHSQAVLFAEGGEILLLHGGKAGKVFQGLHIGLFPKGQHAQVLGTAFHRIDEITGNAGKGLRRKVVVKDEKAGALDLHLCARINEMDAVHGRRGPLVELSRDVFHRQVFLAGELQRIRYRVRDPLPEYRIAAGFHQRIGETEKVIYIDEPEGFQVQGKVFVEFCQQAGRFYTEAVFLFHE